MATTITTLTVAGMSCGHCEARIKKVVSAIGGVHSVSVDLKGGKVTVELDPGLVSIDAIGSAIEEQGYEVK